MPTAIITLLASSARPELEPGAVQPTHLTETGASGHACLILVSEIFGSARVRTCSAPPARSIPSFHGVRCPKPDRRTGVRFLQVAAIPEEDSSQMR